MDIELTYQQETAASLSRTYRRLKKYTGGVITAHRAELTRQKNQANNRKLLAVLKNEGYSVTSVKGYYIENKGTPQEKKVKEESYLVINDSVEGDDEGKLEKLLIKLGRRFEQDSILSLRNGKSAELIGTTKRESTFLPFLKRLKVGKSNFGKIIGEFFTRVGGRSFTFASIDNQPSPTSVFSKWAMKVLAEEVIQTLPEDEE